MARYSSASCRLCRREGVKLLLKGPRCATAKCAIEKRNYFPGQHGQTRAKLSVFGQQLREKQKIKRVYGVLEKQFRKTFAQASKLRGVTGTLLLQLLEKRLDSIVYRAGFAVSRKLARQLIRHGHVRVNGNKIDIPSYILKPGDVISLSDKAKNNKQVVEALELAASKGRCHWIEFDAEKSAAKLLTIPSREDLVDIPMKEQMVIELYSK